MITHVKTKGFKGRDVDEDIAPKTLFLGENMSGKSTRAHAIALAIHGYIPFAANVRKKPADILDDYGTGDKMTVAVVCGGTEFERHFSRAKSGSVSQRLRVDKKKYSAQDFAVELAGAGAPKIIDVNAFMVLSEQKKIDTLFDLFPPKADLKNLDSQIEKVKDEISALNKRDTSTLSTIQRLTKRKAETQLPAGSLAEVQAEIKKVSEQVKEAQENLKQAEIEVARAEERELAEKAAALNNVEKPEPEFKPSSPGNQRTYDFVTGKDLKPQHEYYMPDPAESIQRILDALEDAGCGICAAAIVAKVELKKFKTEVPA